MEGVIGDEHQVCPAFFPTPGHRREEKTPKQARKQAKSTTDHNSWESKGQTEFWRRKNREEKHKDI